MPRLRHFLINDSIQILLDEQMIMSMKDDRHTMLDQQVMNGHFPAWTLFGKLLFTSNALAAPFPKPSNFHSAAIVGWRSTD